MCEALPLAQQITEALVKSLGDAIWATELAFCQGARRCDLWTISANSSAGFKARAYEVKISRADFRRDSAVKQREARLFSEGRGHIDENHRFKLRNMVDAIDAATAAPAVDAQEGDDEGPCTTCYDTGITIQTERACSCEAGDQYRPPAVDAVPAGEVDCNVCGGDCAGANPPVMNCPMRAALSHGEGRK